VPDANQTAGQDVKQESAQELIGGNGHDLLLAAVSIVSPAEADAIVLEGHETMVGDGDAVGVAGQVVENMFGATEGWLGVDHPVLLVEFGEEVAECARRGKLPKRALELEPVVFEQFTKPRPELAAEAAAKCLLLIWLFQQSPIGCGSVFLTWSGKVRGSLYLRVRHGGR
jgi:hypothetical protein